MCVSKVITVYHVETTPLLVLTLSVTMWDGLTIFGNEFHNRIK